MEQQAPAAPPAYEPPSIEDMPGDGPSTVCGIVQQTPVD
jgi:hypothetical protein